MQQFSLRVFSSGNMILWLQKNRKHQPPRWKHIKNDQIMKNYFMNKNIFTVSLSYFVKKNNFKNSSKSEGTGISQ